MRFKHLSPPSLFIVIVLTLATGCTSTMAPVTVKQVPLPAGQVLKHQVALVLDQRLADYEHEFTLSGGSESYPIGSALEDYARKVTTSSFQHVDVVTAEAGAAATASDDLVLIPKVLKSDTSFGDGRYNLTLVMEWTAKDRASQKIVWLKTITATVTEPMGGLNALKHRRLLFEKGIDDLSLQTFKAFQEAHELR